MDLRARIVRTTQKLVPMVYPTNKRLSSGRSIHSDEPDAFLPLGSFDVSTTPFSFSLTLVLLMSRENPCNNSFG
jgi:hypothetical protein